MTRHTPREPADESPAEKGTAEKGADEPTAPEAVLEVTDLSRTFGKHKILDAVSLTVPKGSITVLVGPNGSGKSTLLRCIVGADKADSGSAKLLGQPIDERSMHTRAFLAAVLDDLDFFPDLSVVEHLDLFAKAFEVPDAEALVDDVLNEVGLIDQSGQLPGTLSSGQRRRLALAGALVRPFKLLILDEPEQRLDAAGLAWLGERLRTAREEGAAVLMATHAPSLGEGLADNVVRLQSQPEADQPDE